MPKQAALSPSATPIAREIYRLMVEQGFNQKSLALAAGLSETYCRDLFVGKSRNPKTEHLQRLADVLGVSLSQLMGSEPASPAQDVHKPADVLSFRPSEVLLVQSWRILDDDAKNHILNEIGRLMPTPRRRKGDNI